MYKRQTYANADKGSILINRTIDGFVRTHSNTAVFRSMGRHGFLSALKWACMAVGNSSSGIIEAPSLHIPTVDIGDRQRGRAFGESVIHCINERGEIQSAIQKALSPEFRRICRGCRNPYEGAHTCETMTEVMKIALKKGICLQKTFYDIRRSE